MTRVKYEDMRLEFKRILMKRGFTEDDAGAAAAEAASASVKPRFFRMRWNSRRISSYWISAMLPPVWLEAANYLLNSARPSMA